MVAFWLSFSCWQSSHCSGSTGGEEDHTSPPAPPPWQHQPYPPIWEPLPIKVIRQPATGALHFIRDGEKTNSWQRNTRRKKKTPTKQTWADFQTITTGMPSQNLARVQRPLREWCSATQRKQIHQVPTLVPPLSLSVVGLYHSAAEGDLDLWASLFAIHLVLQCSVGMDSLCVFFSSTDACQRPGLALCRAGPNASIIAPRGKRGLYLSTAEWAKDYSGTPRGKTGPMKSRANHWTFYSKPRLRQRCEEGREEPNTPRSKHPPHSARFVNTSGQT